MTPFMQRVAELVGTPEEDLPGVEEIAPMPDTRISRRIATGTGADRQVAIRSLAEQLVSEANAILAERRRPARPGRRDAAPRARLPGDAPEPSGSGVDDLRGRHGLRPARRRRLRLRAAPGARRARTPCRTSSCACSSSPASPTTTSPEPPTHPPPSEEAPCSTNCEPRSSSRQRKTFTHLVKRYGDRPASRYEEGTIDIQAKENFHYRPLWDPEHDIYDEAFSAFRLTDPYSFTDPRQFYYAPYVTSRAAMARCRGVHPGLPRLA